MDFNAIGLVVVTARGIDGVNRWPLLDPAAMRPATEPALTQFFIPSVQSRSLWNILPVAARF